MCARLVVLGFLTSALLVGMLMGVHTAPKAVFAHPPGITCDVTDPDLVIDNCNQKKWHSDYDLGCTKSDRSVTVCIHNYGVTLQCLSEAVPKLRFAVDVYACDDLDQNAGQVTWFQAGTSNSVRAPLIRDPNNHTVANASTAPCTGPYARPDFAFDTVRIETEGADIKKFDIYLSCCDEIVCP
jgi:hypothetical protein